VRRTKRRWRSRALDLPFLVFVLGLASCRGGERQRPCHGGAQHSVSRRNAARPVDHRGVSAVLANIVNNLPAIPSFVPALAPVGHGAVPAALVGVNGAQPDPCRPLATLLWRRLLRDEDTEVNPVEFTRFRGYQRAGSPGRFDADAVASCRRYLRCACSYDCGGHLKATVAAAAVPPADAEVTLLYVTDSELRPSPAAPGTGSVGRTQAWISRSHAGAERTRPARRSTDARAPGRERSPPRPRGAGGGHGHRTDGSAVLARDRIARTAAAEPGAYRALWSTTHRAPCSSSGPTGSG
jgi:hypothetical protein